MADSENSSLTPFLGAVVDKVVIAVLATAVSTFLFYGYTAYSKAFETLQAQSRASSDLAFKLRDLVLQNTAKVSGSIRQGFLSAPGDNKLSENDHKLALSVAGDIARDARILSSFVEKSSADAANIAERLRRDAFEFRNVRFPDANGIRKFENDIADLQKSFVENFNSEIGAASAKEFRGFFDAFYAQMPPQFRPLNIVLAAAALLAAFVMIITRLQAGKLAESPQPAKSAAKRGKVSPERK